MAKWMLLVTMLVGGCSMYFGDGEASATDATVVAPADAATDAAVGCPHDPDPHSCATLGCGAAFGILDCSRLDEPGAPCYCAEGVTGASGWCFP